MKYKLLVLDLDGTTVPSQEDGMPSSKVRNAIIKAHDYIKISVASGRPYYLAKNILDSLQIDGPCVLDGGAQIIDVKTGKILFEGFLSIKDQKQILKICLPYGYNIYNSEEEDDLMDSLNDVKVKTGKLVATGVTKEDALKMLAELTAISNIAAHPVNFSWVRPDLVDIHITNKEATKKEAIEKLLKFFKVEKKDVIGIGDSPNDMPLFLSVGFKIAMGNAPKELKDQADFIAPSLDEDGVAEVVKKFILPK